MHRSITGGNSSNQRLLLVRRMSASRVKLSVILLACSLITAAAGAQTPAPDTVYLTERISLTTKDGVSGFPVGTRVQVLSRRGDTLTVKSGDSQFDVRADQVTADAQQGKSLSQRDAAEQAAIQQQAAETAARIREARVKSEHASAEQSAAAKPTRDSRLSELKKKEALLQMQLDRLHEDWKDLEQKNPKTSPNAFALKQQIRAIEREIFDVHQQERLVRIESQ
jgi:hypothetical protein